MPEIQTKVKSSSCVSLHKKTWRSWPARSMALTSQGPTVWKQWRDKLRICQNAHNISIELYINCLNQHVRNFFPDTWLQRAGFGSRAVLAPKLKKGPEGHNNHKPDELLLRNGFPATWRPCWGRGRRSRWSTRSSAYNPNAGRHEEPAKCYPDFDLNRKKKQIQLKLLILHPHESFYCDQIGKKFLTNTT